MCVFCVLQENFDTQQGGMPLCGEGNFPTFRSQIDYIFFIFKVMCFSLWMHTEGTGSFGCAAAGSCKLPSMHGGN